MPIEQLRHWTGLLVDVTLLLGALAAVIKFRLLNVLGHRWRSELTCAHWDMEDGSIVFTADYILHNTGPRVLHLQRVTLRLVEARAEGPLLTPNEARVLAERTMVNTDKSLLGLFWIESGERTIFTLRCRLEKLPDTVFVMCGFDMKHRRVPAAFRGFYCRGKPSPSVQAGVPQPKPDSQRA